MLTGILKEHTDFGSIITPDDGSALVQVYNLHHTGCAGTWPIGQRVQYTLGAPHRGQPMAIKVECLQSSH